MTKWEYCALKDPVHEPKLVYYNKNGTVVKDLDSDAVGQCIAELGEDGWEMSGSANLSAIKHIVYFKRRK